MSELYKCQGCSELITARCSYCCYDCQRRHEQRKREVEEAAKILVAAIRSQE